MPKTLRYKPDAADAAEDRAFWAHCEAVAAEVSLWPKWMRGEQEENENVADSQRDTGNFSSPVLVDGVCRAEVLSCKK
jgi:hypothetical protein